MALTRENFKYIIVGCVVVIIGFVLMSGGGSEDPTVFTGGTNEDPGPLFSFRRITLAPFLVMAGYGIVLFGILKRPKKIAIVEENNNSEAETGASEEVLDDKDYQK